MNKIKFILTLTLAALLSLPLSAQIANKVDSLIKNSTLTIEIDQIVPSRGPSKTTIDGYTLTISKDTLNTYLPYFGRVTNAAYGSTNLSIDIKDQPITIEKEIGKKGTYRLSFKSNNNDTNERCDFFIEIFDNGSSTIRIQFSYRDQISYYGNIKEFEQ